MSSTTSPAALLFGDATYPACRRDMLHCALMLDLVRAMAPRRLRLVDAICAVDMATDPDHTTVWLARDLGLRAAYATAGRELLASHPCGRISTRPQALDMTRLLTLRGAIEAGGMTDLVTPGPLMDAVRTDYPAVDSAYIDSTAQAWDGLQEFLSSSYQAIAPEPDA